MAHAGVEMHLAAYEDHIELGRLFDRKIGWIRPLDDLLNYIAARRAIRVIG